MANFEGLIRQALASQNASDPAVRERVYRSSRNALLKMLEKTGNTDDAIVGAQVERLEKSIAAIEAEYLPQAPASPQPAPVQLPVETSQTQPHPTPEPESTPQSAPSPAPEPLPPEVFDLPDTGHDSASPAAAQQPSTGLPTDYTPEPLFPPVDPAPAVPPTPQSTPRPVEPEVSPPEQIDPPTLRQPDPEPVRPTVSTPPADTPWPSDPARATTAPHGDFPDFGSAAEPRVPDPAMTPPTERSGEYSPGRQDPVVDDFIGQAGQKAADDFTVERDTAPVYKRKNPLLRRIWPIALALAVLLVILWILYALLAMPNTGGDTGSAGNAAGQGSQDGRVINLLRPTDLSALTTAGRGTAEIVSQLNQQMLRLRSVRQGTAAGANAEPILLELERGVLRQIAGSEVTVEFYSKSGGSGPAQFAVQCDIGGDSACGRKRFRVGLQPERSIFSLDIPQNVSTDTPAYLAINTDVTNAADASGSGDVIDIIHVRLILDE